MHEYLHAKNHTHPENICVEAYSSLLPKSHKVTLFYKFS